jgi:hypothetical protein
VDIISLVIGFVIGVVLTSIYAASMVKRHDPTPNGLPRVDGTMVALLIMGGLMLVMANPTFAQTATPVPTITIPTNVIFSETNTWINTFAPISAIGIGITIALAVLGYLGKMIAGAFKG